MTEIELCFPSSASTRQYSLLPASNTRRTSRAEVVRPSGLGTGSQQGGTVVNRVALQSDQRRDQQHPLSVAFTTLCPPGTKARQYHTYASFSIITENINNTCLLYTSDAADEEDSVDLGGRRIIKKKRK
eukprot:TRINITY_DN51721_c0_g1_i1.p1 TRINITY_DN51721_c0_g1~~TRINITY_DN51721_c0_g1_i1.p1  ORF type:complete len:129 (-),score=13.11 TRINITY_DN51721_c0_g1_i1:31-417(-)